MDTVLVGQYQDIYMHFLISVLMSEFFKYYIALTNWCQKIFAISMLHLKY